MARVHFLNVGDGACSVIEHDDKAVTMIDICGGEYPIEYLKQLSVKSIFRFILTHPDMDHLDGLAGLAETFKIYNFWDTKNSKEIDDSKKEGRFNPDDWKCYQHLRQSKSKPKALFYLDGASNKYFSKTDDGNKTDDYLQILSPTRKLLEEAIEKNDYNISSYVVLYNIQGFKILFCGDATSRTMAHLIDKHAKDIANIDVLVALHHGRQGDYNDFSYLDLMRPRFVVAQDVDDEFIPSDVYKKYKIRKLLLSRTNDVILQIQNGEVSIAVTNKKMADVINAKLDRHITCKVLFAKVSAWWLPFKISAE